MSTSEKFDEFMSKVMQTENINPGDDGAEVFKRIFESTKSKAIQTLVESMEKDIRLVALKVGPLTWLKARRIVKNFKRDFEKKAEDGAREYVDSVIEVCLNHVQMLARQSKT